MPQKHTSFLTINPQQTINPQSNFTPLPDLNNPSKINLDPIKDSALNVISLNIRSLTITDNSVKLKRLFNLDAAIIVLTEVSVDSTAYMDLCRLWREQMSRYQVWYSGTQYRGLMIMVKKNSGCYFQNEFRINDDAVLVDLAFPGGKIVNAACVYGPSHKDDKDFLDLFKRNLDLRNNNG